METVQHETYSYWELIERSREPRTQSKSNRLTFYSFFFCVLFSSHLCYFIFDIRGMATCSLIRTTMHKSAREMWPDIKECEIRILLLLVIVFSFAKQESSECQIFFFFFGAICLQPRSFSFYLLNLAFEIFRATS